MTAGSQSFRVLYDGQCPICVRQARSITRLDRGRGQVVVQDVTSADFDPGAFGLTIERAMGGIHGVFPDGRVVRGMDVLREVYRRVGRGWMLAPTGWPLVRPLFDRFYDWFARNRMWLSAPWRGSACETDRCGLDHSSSGATSRP
jgi:predicted DCC family thiol-disulfide oxidoreductase YuxK